MLIMDPSMFIHGRKMINFFFIFTFWTGIMRIPLVILWRRQVHLEKMNYSVWYANKQEKSI